MEPLRLEPAIRRYAWGDPSVLPALLGEEEDGGPWAEAWYGAHPLGSARVEGRPLAELISEDPVGLLGPEVAAQHGGLPYLLKILTAARPLSVQLHPDRQEAKEGFAREEAAGLPRDDPRRSFRDPNSKPELLLALTPFEALCGFRKVEDIRSTLDFLPALRRILPPLPDSEPGSLRRFLEGCMELPAVTVKEALAEVLASSASDGSETESMGDVALPVQRMREARARLAPKGGDDRPKGTEDPDPGLLFFLLLEHLRLEPGEALFLPPGIPHAYLSGAAVELTGSSDNVLRAGLTSKHVDRAGFLRAARFESGAPEVLRPGTATGPILAPAGGGFQLELLKGEGREEEADGPEILLALPEPGRVAPDAPGEVGRLGEGGKREEDPAVLLRATAGLTAGLTTEGDSLSLRPGEAAFIPHGLQYEVTVGTGMVAVRVGVSPQRSENAASFVTAIRRNVAATEELLARGTPPAVVGAVSGSAGTQAYWRRALEESRDSLGARAVVSLHEDLPVNQAFGLLLLWQRLRPELRPGEGALVAFLFGEGSRAAPFTEAEGGQKPAIRTFVRRKGPDGSRFLSTGELALRYFTPVESHLRRSGFEGIVVKWGDEVQLPILDLRGSDPRLAGADVIRFISLRVMTPAEAESKDWIGVDGEGRIRAFIPRRPLAAMETLAERGWLQRRSLPGGGTELVGGVNLGSIALSRKLLDLLLEEFGEEVNDPAGNRRSRPDLDPQFFTALTVAALSDPAERAEAWATARRESAAVARLEELLPGVLARLEGVLARFQEQHGRPVRMQALDFGDQYWGDVGEHPRMYHFYTALREPGPEGQVARALAGIQDGPDSRGNWLVGDCRIGPGVEVRDSFLVDARVEEGEVTRSVLVGSRCRRVQATEAFDVLSVARELVLGSRAGSYRVLARSRVEVRAGERAATVLLPDGEVLLRVSEDTDLRDRRSTYEKPLPGNPISFQEAHRQVMEMGPEELGRRRGALEAEILASFPPANDG